MFNELYSYSIHCFNSTVKSVCGSKSGFEKSWDSQKLYRTFIHTGPKPYLNPLKMDLVAYLLKKEKVYHISPSEKL